MIEMVLGFCLLVFAMAATGTLVILLTYWASFLLLEIAQMWRLT